MASKASTTTKKRPGAARASRKTAAEGIEAQDAGEGATDPDAVVRSLRKRELVDLVVSRSGVKKKDAKPVVEATLAVLAESLAQGRAMNLEPLGKLKINRSKEVTGARVIVSRIRQSTRLEEAATEPLAEPAE